MRPAFLALGVLAAIAAIAPARADSKQLSQAGSTAAVCRGWAGQAKQQADTIPAGWHKHVSKAAGYQVAFPVQPKVVEGDAQDGQGRISHTQVPMALGLE